MLRGYELLYRVVNKILVLVDGSRGSLHALRYAANLALTNNASVLLVNVVKVPTFYTLDAGIPQIPIYHTFSELTTDLEEQGRISLQNAAHLFEEFGVDVYTKLVTTFGAIAEILCKVAKEEKCDLIVMVDSPVRGLRKLFETRVSTEVVKKAHCPVIVIK